MKRSFLAGLVLLGLVTASVRADDWPQWMGPRRDGVWRETGLMAAFPKEGLKVRWRVPVGGGYASAAVAEGRVFVTDFVLKSGTERPKDAFAHEAQPGVERVMCIDDATGKVLWTHEYDCPYNISYSIGPRTTPAVDGERVYTLGAEGDLLCLSVADGKMIWSKKLSGEKAATPGWGFAGHPLIDGDRLIVGTSGRDPETGLGAITAFDKLTGKQVWTALSDRSGYSAPMIHQAGGTRQLIYWTAEAVNSLDPETGKVYWSYRYGPIKYDVAITTPRFHHDDKLGDLLIVTSQVEGTLVLKLDAEKPAAVKLWQRGGTMKNSEALHSLIGTPIVRDGHIYGVCSKGELRGLDLTTGDRLWETYEATNYSAGPLNWASAFIVPIGESGTRCLIANEHGDLILADVDARGYHEVSRTHLLDATNTDAHRPVLWSHPALANRTVYWRNDKELVAASMGE